MTIRLDKLLTHLGVASRSGVRAVLKAGRVRVNQAIVKDPAYQADEKAEVTLDGQKLDTRLSRHLMLHKPAGVLTAKEDSRQKTVMELLPPVYTALGCMPVGRLDKDTTGLLLLTTDGELAHRLISPERHVDKVYEAAVDGQLAESDAEAFAAGIPLKEFTCLPAKLDILSPSQGRVTVREGKFHQVKRMFAAVGKPVTELHRVRFGPLALDPALHPGEFRELTESEIAALYAAAGMKE
ncbi:MAG: 16S rRNA pseudouridine(516) synthase [Clostridia bacterium]|nr:16S rRNA pseudouridine(516) synthase [Clostridia bacterium]